MYKCCPVTCRDTLHSFIVHLTSGRNPLHLAAMNNYTQTVELLHSVHSHLLDQVDKDGVSHTCCFSFFPLLINLLWKVIVKHLRFLQVESVLL